MGNYIFHTFWKEFVEFIKREKSYATVRSAPLKDVLVKGAGIGNVIGFYTFEMFWRNVVEIINIKLAYTTVRFASLKNALVSGAKIGTVIGFYRILQVFNKLFGSCRIQSA